MDYTVIDINVVNESLNNLDSAILQFDENRLVIKKDPFFQKLQEANLDNGFINSYDENNDKLISAIQFSKQTLLSVLNNMEGLDQAVQGDLSDLANDSDNQSDDYSDRENSEQNDDELVDNSKLQLEQYSSLSMSDLQVIASELVKLADENNTTLDKILSDEEYTLKIHSRLLRCLNLSENFKLLIEQGKTNISQTILSNIFSGNFPDIIGLNDETINVLQTYLTMTANNNNISLQQLLNDNDYILILKKALGDFKNIPTYLNSENNQSINSMLLDIYDGNNISNLSFNEVSIIREFIDVSAQNNDSNIEIYLNDSTDISNDI